VAFLGPARNILRYNLKPGYDCFLSYCDTLHPLINYPIIRRYTVGGIDSVLKKAVIVVPFKQRFLNKQFTPHMTDAVSLIKKFKFHGIDLC
jgi:hypothetical protein